MPPKKKIKISLNTKRYIFIIILSFLGFATIFADPKTSILGEYLNLALNLAFWEYYKWIFTPLALFLAWFLIKNEKEYISATKFFWIIFYFFSIISIIWFFKIFFVKSWYISVFNLYEYLANFLWKPLYFWIFFLLFLVSLVMIFNFSPINFLNHLFKIPGKIWEIKETFVWEWLQISKKSEKTTKENSETEKLKAELEKIRQEKQELERKRAEEKQQKIDFEKIQIEKPKKIEIEEKSTQNLHEETNDRKVVKINTNPEFSKWQYPSLNLLNEKPKNLNKIDQNEIRTKELEIQEKLLQFKIEVEMLGYQIWPTVIQYRLKPKDWIKLQKIVNLKDDLALALHAKSLRVQAPIPWLWAVWIEIPNPMREAVFLKEVLSSKEFSNPKLEIPIAIWKNVNWETVVWDLAEMPHLLVAWQTKSWKSVWMNGFIMSMIYKFSPSELRMIMVDPKMVELSVYNGIPHLLTPVVTNANKALNALKWSVAEMLRRYELASKINAKNLREYNSKVDKADKFHYIVIVIDELADLMMSWNKKEIEDSITRIAQMWRAVWMHLIIATQRPSVNVLTWLIKANIPTRIAFTVASQVDSRTIIEQWWAEDLLWKWDLLFSMSWTPELERIQWVFVETPEVEKVVNELKLTIDPDMLQNLQIPEISEWESKFKGSVMEGYGWDLNEDPEVLNKAIEILKQDKKASTSHLQRRMWIGYARAAKILDILEEIWLVWPSNWSKPRDIYID